MNKNITLHGNRERATCSLKLLQKPWLYSNDKPPPTSVHHSFGIWEKEKRLSPRRLSFRGAKIGGMNIQLSELQKRWGN